MRFLIRWLAMSIAVAAAVLLVPGITVSPDRAWMGIVVLALVTGLLNATLGLVLKAGTFGCIIMTLGLFNLVINAGMLYLASYITDKWFNLGVAIHGFWPAFWGGIVISIVSGILSWFLPEHKEERS